MRVKKKGSMSESHVCHMISRELVDFRMKLRRWPRDCIMGWNFISHNSQ